MGIGREKYECSNHDCGHTDNVNVDTLDDASNAYTQLTISITDTHLSTYEPDNVSTNDSREHIYDDGDILRKSSRTRHKPYILTMEMGFIRSDRNNLGLCVK